MEIRNAPRLMAAAAAFFALLQTIPEVHAEERASYRVGVVPQYSEITTHHQWTPVLEYLGKKTNTQIKLRLFKSFPEFESAIRKGELEFAYMNPYQIVMARKAQGYVPLIRDNFNQLTGILVVRKDSGLHKLQDIRDRNIAFPSAYAFAASLYLRALLLEKEKINIRPVYARTHGNAIRMVLLGKAQAAGVVQRTLDKQRKEARDLLRVLYRTPGIPAHPFAAHARVPAELRKKLVRTFLEMRKTEKGRKLLQAISIAQPFEADYEMDYQRLETLKLEHYAQPE